jgi:NTE family protein
MQDVVLNRKSRARTRPSFECIALMLQGGGALGSYQAGVYEALSEANLHPDFVAGISIGAINSAIIAGNPPDQRVAEVARVLGRDHRQSAVRLGRYR